MINNMWDDLLKEEYNKDYFIRMINFIDNEYKVKKIYPLKKDIFNCLKYSNINEIKVVIIGQDPYHGENQAHGLAFSTLSDKRPNSLNNIFKELKNDLNICRNNNNLTDWYNQGILLLNTILTVEENKPLSHKNIGWEIFTDKIISIIDTKCNNVVFILWGNNAKKKKELIKGNHYIIESSHPSGFSANKGFFGSKPFSKTNNYLLSVGKNKINW